MSLRDEEPVAEFTPAGPAAPFRESASSRPDAMLLEAPPVPVPGSRSGLVFLDFDHTIIAGDAGPLFGWYLFQLRRHQAHGNRLGALRLFARYVPFFLGMMVQGGFYKMGAVRRSTIVRGAYRGLRGVPVDQFTSHLASFAQEVLVPRILPQVRKEINDHFQAGRGCMVITTGMEALVRPVLDAIDGRIGLVGCRLESRKGVLTGRVQGPLFGQDKANILHAHCRAVGVATTNCWAYSDHYSDVHMLEAVGTGVAVNPRGKLRRLAKRRGWRILDT